MLEQATIDTTDKSKETTTAVLIGILSFAVRIGFFAPLESLDIALKEVRHSVVSKVQALICGVVLCCGTIALACPSVLAANLRR